MSHQTESDFGTLRAGLLATKDSIIAYPLELVIVSVVWFVASLPLVTIGPATLGAYTAVADLRQNKQLDLRAALRRVRSQFVAATALGLLPWIFIVIVIQYGRLSLVRDSMLVTVMAVGSAYAAIYVVLVLIPTFVRLAMGDRAGAALRGGIRWTSKHPTLTLTIGLLTVVLFVVTLALTIAFVLLFSGITFMFHTETIIRCRQTE